MTMRVFSGTIAALILAMAATPRATGNDGDDRGHDRDDRDGREPYAIGLWGDLPYSDLQAQTGVPNLIADMNAQKLAFTVHDGDLKVGSGVPGSVLCRGVHGLVPCVENRRWHVGGVTYATLNVTGSCNNLCDTAPDATEFLARNHADIVWLQETFAEATARGSAAVTLIAQANPGWDTTDPTRAPLRDPKTLVQTYGHPDGFRDFLSALRDEVIAFRRPVAFVHGDSHYFRLDKPFLDAQGRRLENFTRVETFGDNQANGNNDVNWLKVRVNARSREVFTYQPQIVPANRTAVPAP